MASPVIAKLAGALKGSGTVATQAAINAQELAQQRFKALSYSFRNATDVEKKALLPDQERHALVKIMTGAVMLNAPVLVPSITINTSGKFEVTLEIDPRFSIGSSPPSAEQKRHISQALRAKVAKLVSQYGAWENLTVTTITLRSKNSYPFLLKVAKPSNEFMKNFGQCALSVDKTTAGLLACAEKLVADAAKGKKSVHKIAIIDQLLRNAKDSVRAIMKQVVAQIGGRFNGQELKAIKTLKGSSQLRTFLKRVEGHNIIGSTHFLYDDSDDKSKANCTIGYGNLVHHGPCHFGSRVVSDNLAAYRAAAETGNLTNTMRREEPYLRGISEEQAEAILEEKISEAERYVKVRLSNVLLSQQMFDAYTSLLFNVGIGKAEAEWNAFKNVYKGLYRLALIEFLTIRNVNGKPSPGLENRCRAEVGLILHDNQITVC